MKGDIQTAFADLDRRVRTTAVVPPSSQASQLQPQQPPPQPAPAPAAAAGPAAGAAASAPGGAASSDPLFSPGGDAWAQAAPRPAPTDREGTPQTASSAGAWSPAPPGQKQFTIANRDW